MKLHKGFTLIEVMITVAIVAILAAVAIPAYSDYATRGKIPEATAELAARRVAAEQYFLDNRTYADLSAAIKNPACVVPLTPPTPDINFVFSCTTQNANAYTVQAQGINSMSGFNYTIDQLGTKTSAITKPGWAGNSPVCWITKKGGAC